jgi:hypothetical protein
MVSCGLYSVIQWSQTVGNYLFNITLWSKFERSGNLILKWEKLSACFSQRESVAPTGHNTEIQSPPSAKADGNESAK